MVDRLEAPQWAMLKAAEAAGRLGASEAMLRHVLAAWPRSLLDADSAPRRQCEAMAYGGLGVVVDGADGWRFALSAEGRSLAATVTVAEVAADLAGG